MKERFVKKDYSVEENAHKIGMQAMIVTALVGFAGALGAYWGLKTGVNGGSDCMAACWKAVNHELMDQGILTDDQLCEAINKLGLSKSLID